MEEIPILEMLRDPKYYVMCFNLIVFSITNSAVTNFNPLIISGYGFSRSKTALMSSPQAAVALVAQVSATILMVYVPNIRCILWFLSTLPALAGAVMIRSKIPNSIVLLIEFELTTVRLPSSGHPDTTYCFPCRCLYDGLL